MALRYFFAGLGISSPASADGIYAILGSGRLGATEPPRAVCQYGDIHYEARTGMCLWLSWSQKLARTPSQKPRSTTAAEMPLPRQTLRPAANDGQVNEAPAALKTSMMSRAMSGSCSTMRTVCPNRFVPSVADVVMFSGRGGIFQNRGHVSRRQQGVHQALDDPIRDAVMRLLVCDMLYARIAYG